MITRLKILIQALRIVLGPSKPIYGYINGPDGYLLTTRPLDPSNTTQIKAVLYLLPDNLDRGPKNT